MVRCTIVAVHRYALFLSISFSSRFRGSALRFRYRSDGAVAEA